ncbi:deoxyribose-phosphate aldolase [Arthrobacter silviterrae]|uniref:Deoxyribose-phosphate aldolase n=1 Tax=Arthrobacter silviterrae TaxID=2026658 RepID=A0ABX0D981_9MICC|nr:deoxyribose-phosphate aldolase [Arthrobacter silviterrae]MDQ0279341.1 deoxyribose-phosphate aldolase [Arthrobacter silviterrae]NGN83459.1 deoxyribose-phosphate aldolase [Arthrobacter silviterrae]
MTPHASSTPQDASTGLAAYIDHTLLKPEASEADILQLCKEAAEHHFKSVCVNPLWVETAKRALRGTGVLTCAVVGFPLGANNTDVKVFEARGATMDGADEVDMVINIAAARALDKETLVNDISAVAEVVHGEESLLKVIIETSLLSDAEKVLACQAAVEAGADYVKTSTGFNGGGATAQDVALMRQTVGPDIGVKASGGVRSREKAEEMIAAGATRIGTSSGIAIVTGAQGTGSY